MDELALSADTDVPVVKNSSLIKISQFPLIEIFRLERLSDEFPLKNLSISRRWRLLFDKDLPLI